MKIAVLMGGPSSEREVSLMSGRQVAGALRRLGHNVIELDPDEDGILALLTNRPDVVFIALHGRYGEDGCIQGLLELAHIPYTGSGVLASALAMDKIMAKVVFRSLGIPTPEWVTVTRSDAGVGSPCADDALLQVGLPCVVKPSAQGSTVGVTVVRDAESLADAVHLALSYGDQALIEQFVTGTEITVGVLGDSPARALPTLEIVSKKPTYDWEAKYTPGMSEHIIPARVPEEVRAKCQDLAVRAHTALGCRGFSRVDMIATPSGEVQVLEVNTVPGLTAVSLLPDAARAVGISFEQLVQMAVDGALAVHAGRTVE
ncbi:MAG: D-alanine--D-alanine ligase [Firmicutes bacterium]|nr:D-alanine--D-alanine ligase [Bacillota bacterium]